MGAFRFLVERGLVDGERYTRENQQFYEQYQAGTLDIDAFLTFMLRPLAEHPHWPSYWPGGQEFIEEKIRPILLPSGGAGGMASSRWRYAADHHRHNRFITAPIAELFGIADLLATEPGCIGGRYTGHSVGIPCFQQGKVTRLNQWLAETGHDLRGKPVFTATRTTICHCSIR